MNQSIKIKGPWADLRRTMAIGKAPVQWRKVQPESSLPGLKVPPNQASPVDRGHKPTMGLKVLVEQSDSADPTEVFAAILLRSGPDFPPFFTGAQ